MLWSKAWLETRARFLISLAGIVFLCSFSVFHAVSPMESWMNDRYYNHVLSEGHGLLTIAWAVTVTMLMMGGLLREHAHGSASFTLALPVSRGQLMGTRIGVGLLQAFLLALVPWCVMALILRTIAETFSLSQTAFSFFLLLSGGAVVFALALLVSSLVAGEYTAPVASLGILLTIAGMMSDKGLRPFNPLAFMMGGEYRDIHTNALVGPYPWVESGVWVFLAALMVWSAIAVTKRRDF